MKRLLGGCVAVLSSVAIALMPGADAQTMLITGGAVYYLFPGITNNIGSGFYPDADTTVIKYPGTPILVEQSIGRGVDNLDAAIKSAEGPIVVAGLSEGSMVIDHEQARLLSDPDAPPADQVTFIIFGNPERGVLALLPNGTYVPLVGYTTSTPVESQYDTIIVIGEYDGFADPPDRPWNLFSTLNAVIGAGVVHSLYADVDPASIPPENVTTEVNSKDATVTRYLAPTDDLPLTLPLRFIAPPAVVDRIDDVVRPIVDAGYSRNDDAGDRRPYLSHGEIVFPSAPSTPMVTQTRTRVTKSPEPTPSRSTSRLNDTHQQSRSDTHAERRAERRERREQRQAERAERRAGSTRAVGSR